MKNIFLLTLIILLASLAACAQTGIRAVDFQNFTYVASCTGETPVKVTVKNGEFSSETKMEGYVDRFYFKVFPAMYGDLTGDKQDEAVILSVCNTGGTGDFSEGFIYTMKDGKPTLLARIPGGDRADGGLRALTIEHGLLVVDANDASEYSGACCPEFATKTTYRLDIDKLIVVGHAVRRELYPSERISFARGTYGKTFTIKLPPDDLKRYVLEAAEGQVLSIAINTDAASLRMLTDAQVTEGTNKLTVKLPKKGDYIFEVGNWGANSIEVTVTIRIR